jgi:hypothetical protein
MSPVLKLVAVLGLWAVPAWAFPWMVKHNYGSCAACHVDPSGAGQLTVYGRAQAETLLRFKANKPPTDQEPDLPKSVNFLWFLELPEAVNLSGNLRGGALLRPASTAAPVVPLVMATDLYATVNVGAFVGHATVGAGLRRMDEAIVFPRCDTQQGPCGPALVSREHWVGAKLLDDALMLRAGRLALPFGLRNDEHTSWVRALSRTDTNLSQQTGVSAAYNAEKLRGEVMGIAGNFQVGPDLYRERGYAAFADYSLAERTSLGVSSLVTIAGADVGTGLPTTRHVHGVFLRWSPTAPLAVLAEADFLAWHTTPGRDRLGFAALVQGDYEPVQGLHLLATAEGMHQGDGAHPPSLGVWGSVTWYFAPHCELRADAIYRSLASADGARGALSILAQVHVFL